MNHKGSPHGCLSVPQALPEISGAAPDDKPTARERWGAVRSAVALRSMGRSLSRRHRNGKGIASPVSASAGAHCPAQ